MYALAQVSGEAQAQAQVPRTREEPRFHDTLDLVALPTPVTVARMFIGDTLRRWHALFIEDHMEATGPTSGTSWTDITALNPIRLRSLGYQRTIVFEVTDVHPESLAKVEDEELPEDHGLGLVDALASRRGSFVAPQGRVIWAELPVYERTAANLPLRPPAPTFDPTPLQGDATAVSIEEVKARLTELGSDVPTDSFNDANHKTLDVTGEMRTIVATTNNVDLELTLVRMEEGNTMTIDGAMMIMEAREDYWRIVEQM